KEAFVCPAGDGLQRGLLGGARAPGVVRGVSVVGLHHGGRLAHWRFFMLVYVMGCARSRPPGRSAASPRVAISARTAARTAPSPRRGPRIAPASRGSVPPPT